MNYIPKYNKEDVQKEMMHFREQIDISKKMIVSNCEDMDAIAALVYNVYQGSIQSMRYNWYTTNKNKSIENLDKLIDANKGAISKFIGSTTLEMFTNLNIYRNNIDVCIKDLSIKLTTFISPLLDNADQQV